MSHWWSRNAKDFAAFSDDDKLRVEDLTGRIPLLLEPFLGNSGMNLDALEPGIWNEDVLDLVVRTMILESRSQRITTSRRKPILIYSRFMITSPFNPSVHLYL